MILNNPITLTVNNESVTLSSFDVVITDDSSRKFVIARLSSFLYPLVLWSGEHYDNAGDYTQVQVEEKILELLGYNPQEKLQSLVI